ncbi:DNA primase [bacterium]|nr:DNA primase [bacterium]
MKITEDKIQEIREATDIVELISQYATLKKKGKSFMGLCPFHTEKTPSFSVDPIRGFYHCFGCGAGGNVFTFIMQMERVSFPEAVRSLAEKAGIQIPVYQKDDQQLKEIETLYRSNQFAVEFFQRCLHHTTEGKRALTYLLKRHFIYVTIQKFQIGYAPDSWDQLLKEAGKASIRPKSLQNAGLVIVKNEGEGYYDRFRGRLMFPILNPSGRVIGFGGRKLNEGEPGPKYINTPETQIYQKSRVLYGLHQSISGIRRENRVLLVEGYTDLMRLHQCGLDFGVATSGTALTEDQARMLVRYTKNAIMVFDSDLAGFNAALRGIDILVGTGLHVQIITLPNGYDPDGFLRDQGCEALEGLLKSALNFVDFQIGRLLETGQLQTHSQKAEAIRTILTTVAKISDPLERNFIIKDVAEKLDTEEPLLVQQLQQIQKGEKIRLSESDTRKQSAYCIAEEGILNLLLEDLDRWGKRIFQFIEPRYFEKREFRILMDMIYEGYLRGDPLEPKALLDHFSEDQMVAQQLARLLSEKMDPDVDRFQFGLDCVLKLRENEMDQMVDEIKEKMRSAQSKGEDVSQYSKIWMENRKKWQLQRNAIMEAWKKDVEI